MIRGSLVPSMYKRMIKDFVIHDTGDHGLGDNAGRKENVIRDRRSCRRVSGRVLALDVH